MNIDSKLLRRQSQRFDSLRFACFERRDNGGVLAWDGQLEDDARLVVALARTAASHGASILTRMRVTEVGDGGEVSLRDELTGDEHVVRARVIVNAAGVWASELQPEVALRPARGTHLVFDGERFGHPTTALTLPIPGESNRYLRVMALRRAGNETMPERADSFFHVSTNPA